MADTNTILLIDDEGDILDVLREYFEEKGYRVLSATNGEAGVEIARREAPDMVVVDLRLPGMDGTQVVEQIREADARVPVVIVTAYPSFESAVHAIRARAYDYLVKPFQMSYLGMVVENAIQDYQRNQQSQKLQERLAEAKEIVAQLKDRA